MQYNIIDTSEKLTHVIIWMHGLGADANDMLGLAEQLPPSKSAGFRHVFLNAPMRPVTLNGGMAMPAWYDILGHDLKSREDAAGIQASAEQIVEAIRHQMAEGFESQQIILSGFSQGGAMALYTALTFAKPLAGVIALSAYLPLANEIQALQPPSLPVFLAGGSFDPMVLPQWVDLSAQHLDSQGYKQISRRQYDMGHAVCMEEIHDIGQWLEQITGEMPR